MNNIFGNCYCKIAYSQKTQWINKITIEDSCPLLKTFKKILPIWLFILLLTKTTVLGQAPQISSFTPTTICQGEELTITGNNFNGTTEVTTGGTKVDTFTIVNATILKAIISYKSASGKIIVITNKGSDTSKDDLTVKPAPQISLFDKSNPDDEFKNCNGNSIYTLTVENKTTPVSGTSKYEIDWGDNSPHFIQTNWPKGNTTTHTYVNQGYFLIKFTVTPDNNCIKSITYRFYNGANPLASLSTKDPTTGLCSPAIVTFKIGNWFNNSTGTIYILNYDDNTPPDTLKHPLNNLNQRGLGSAYLYIHFLPL